jgi:hypothetical protein
MLLTGRHDGKNNILCHHAHIAMFRIEVALYCFTGFLDRHHIPPAVQDRNQVPFDQP